MLILTQDTLSFWRWQQQGVLLSFLSHIKLQSSVLTAAPLYFMVSREVCCQLRAHRDEISLSALLCCGIWWACNISKGALFHPTTIPPSWVSSYTLNQIVHPLKVSQIFSATFAQLRSFYLALLSVITNLWILVAPAIWYSSSVSQSWLFLLPWTYVTGYESSNKVKTQYNIIERSDNRFSFCLLLFLSAHLRCC